MITGTKQVEQKNPGQVGNHGKQHRMSKTI